jgi:hypothetical protein
MNLDEVIGEIIEGCSRRVDSPSCARIRSTGEYSASWCHVPSSSGAPQTKWKRAWDQVARSLLSSHSQCTSRANSEYQGRPKPGKFCQTIQVSALALSLLLGIFASFAIGLGTFGWARLNGSNWMLSWLQCGAVIFLWCNLYISMKDWRVLSGNLSAVRPAQGETHEFATQFAIRAGSRIQVIYEKDVLWVSAARDYAELHTPSGTFLLRETMQSLQQRLDPERFVRIHRSRIVRWEQISELTRQDNGEYRVKLLDGSVHRSSRTFAPRLENWLRFGTR